MHPKSKEFKKLQSEWDKKLKDSGFEDAEYTDSYGLIKLRMSAQGDKTWSRYTVESFEAKAEFYRRAGTFLNHYEFETSREKLIWKHYSEGKTFRAIASLVTWAGYPLKKDRVRHIVLGLAKKMLKGLGDD